MVQDHSLHQLVQQGTRGSNILDLVLTNDPALVENVDVVEILMQYSLTWHCVPLEHTNQEDLYTTT